jgi:dTDP-4-dehydrorhamnose reductase
VKVLVLGGNGMAGHLIRMYLAESGRYSVWHTIRESSDDFHAIQLDVTDLPAVVKAARFIRPDVVINATGILNEAASQNIREAICVNSLFPHQMARLGEKMGFRFIQISTDCVFSGMRGEYKEADIADGTTVYAKTKSLGEVTYGRHLTIRTSIIGPELKDGIGLFHWFMQQKGEIQGYRNVFWNGVTTLELAKTMDWVLQKPEIAGLVHLAAPEKISKYQLLLWLKETFAREDVTICPYDGIVSDKSLVNTRPDFAYVVPPYSQALQELYGWIRTHECYNYPLG